MPPLSGWTLWITGFVGKVPALDEAMSLFVSDFFIPVSICLVMLGLWLGHSDPVRREALQKTIMNAAVAIGISTLTVRVLNMRDFWPRPFLVDDSLISASAARAAEIVFYFPHDPTFPSNGATIAFAAATGVFLGHRKAGLLLYALATIWAVARFYAGIHFAVDIMAGVVVGVSTALLISKLFMPRTEPIPSLALKAGRFLYIA